MVKHNNSISNGHFRKHWQKFVKTDFDKFSKKKKRKNNRLIKISNFKRYNFSPINLIRPVVNNPSKIYNIKTRLGRGFSFGELKKSEIPEKLALSIGVSLDKRRRNNFLRQNLNISRLNVFFEKVNSISFGRNTSHGLKCKKKNLNNPIQSKIKKKYLNKISENSKKFFLNKEEVLKAFHKLRPLN